MRQDESSDAVPKPSPLGRNLHHSRRDTVPGLERATHASPVQCVHADRGPTYWTALMSFSWPAKV